MGLLDRAKSQMATATAMAKDAAQKGQAKLDALQAKRAADALLRDLGATVYGQRTGRAAASAESDAARLVERLRAHEAEHGPIDLGLEADNAAGPPPSAGAAPAGPPPSGQHV